MPDGIFLVLHICDLITIGRCLHVKLERISKCYYLFLFVWFIWMYLYSTGLTGGIQGLGALQRSERWTEGAQTAALLDTV